MIKVTIVGGGLSVLYSYFGARQAGFSPFEIEICRVGEWKVAGAIFMYESPIPYPSVAVSSILLGSCREYALKQWNDATSITSAHKRFKNGLEPQVYEQLYDAQELATTLWGMIPNKRDRMKPLSEQEIIETAKHRKAVICCFPDDRTRLEYRHLNYVKPIPIHCNAITTTHYTVIYGGLMEFPWVRQTTMPNRIFTEYPWQAHDMEIMEYEEERGNVGGKVVHVPDLVPATPKLEWEDRKVSNILRVGRMGSMDRTYLSHQAMLDTYKFLGEL